MNLDDLEGREVVWGVDDFLDVDVRGVGGEPGGSALPPSRVRGSVYIGGDERRAGGGEATAVGGDGDH